MVIYISIMDEDIKKAAEEAIIRMKSADRRLAEWIIRQGLDRENSARVTVGIGDLIDNKKDNHG